MTVHNGNLHLQIAKSTVNSLIDFEIVPVIASTSTDDV
jgi:hypothetical protein